jgi:hypothetical protein
MPPLFTPQCSLSFESQHTDPLPTMSLGPLTQWLLLGEAQSLEKVRIGGRTLMQPFLPSLLVLHHFLE